MNQPISGMMPDDASNVITRPRRSHRVIDRTTQRLKHTCFFVSPFLQHILIPEPQPFKKRPSAANTF